ncbi:MAG TPA: glycosyltransferase family 2 protein [Chloroflexota bacterium]|nr:glycosyltransferase family 2 protein [Chloroflexota bacterium]HUM68196.1 glycosyltransferase family 2 protein [Chloroflexota bacterium]
MAAIVFVLSVGTILYTYIVYPALLAALARLWSRPVHTAVHTPTVTLLIAAYNEEETIAQKIENSLALDYPPEHLQILVAADGSADRTAPLVAAYAHQNVVLNYEPARRGKMAAINRAMPRATGEIVVFSDANNFYQADALRELVKPFADASVGAASGAKIIAKGDGVLGESEGLYWRYESFIKEKETAVHSSVGVAGEILAIRRHLFEPPPDDIINDDFYIAARLLHRGYRVVYVPAARSIERISPTAQDEMARRARIVAGRYQAIWRSRELLPWKRPLLTWQIVSHKFLRPLVPLAMIAAWAANLVLAFRARPLARLLFLLQMGFYATAVLGACFQPGGRLGKLLYLPTYLVTSNLAALLGLGRFLAGKQTTRWQRVPRRQSAIQSEKQ